jgi:CMP-N,N'-diacetyllegionaminic acid synthase
MAGREGLVTAIITARGGSKGLPRKNLRPLRGRPLIAYTIAAASACPLVAGVYVSTEDDEIAAVSAGYGAKIVKRPVQLATDNAKSIDAVRHALSQLASARLVTDYVVLLQPTSPLRAAKQLTECLTSFVGSRFASVVSVCEAEHHPRKMMFAGAERLEPLFGPEWLDSPRQLLPVVYRQNGAIYSARWKDLVASKGGFFIPAVMPFRMSKSESIDIDDEFDLMLAEAMLDREAGERGVS